MKKYLIALDLDGTTIPHIYNIDPYTVKVFKELGKLGHKIVITTGRPNRSSIFVYDAMELDTPLINYNGSLITNPKDPNFPVYEDLMNREHVVLISEFCKGKIDFMFCERNDNIYSTMDEPRAYDLMHHNDLSKIIVGDIKDIIPEDGIHGSLIVAFGGHSKEIVDYVNATFDDINARVWSWGGYDEIVEIYSTKSTKDKAVLYCLKALNMDISQLFATGDSQNDMELFDIAALSVCPEHANPKLKEKSKYVCGPVWECGAAKFFVNFFNLKI